MVDCHLVLPHPYLVFTGAAAPLAIAQGERLVQITLFEWWEIPCRSTKLKSEVVCRGV